MNTARCANREKLASQCTTLQLNMEKSPTAIPVINREQQEAGLSGSHPADNICPRTLPGTQFSSFAACNITMRLRNQPIKRATKQLAGYKHTVNPSGRPNITMDVRSTSMPSCEWPVAQYMHIK